MIDLKNESQEPALRSDVLIDSYKRLENQPLNEQEVEKAKLNVLADISITLGLMFDVLYRRG